MARLEGFGPSEPAVNTLTYDGAVDRIGELIADSKDLPFGAYVETALGGVYAATKFGRSLVRYTHEYTAHRINEAGGTIDGRDIAAVGRPFLLGGTLATEVDMSRVPSQMEASVLDNHMLYTPPGVPVPKLSCQADEPLPSNVTERNKRLLRAYPDVLRVMVFSAGELAEDKPAGEAPNQHFVDMFAEGYAFTSFRIARLVSVAIRAHNYRFSVAPMNLPINPQNSSIRYVTFN